MYDLSLANVSMGVKQGRRREIPEFQNFFEVFRAFSWVGDLSEISFIFRVF